MNDIGIYIKEITINEALNWLHSIFNSLELIDKDQCIYKAIYNEKELKIQINENIENKNICEIYFNPNNTQWRNDIACARQAHKDLGKVIFFTPVGEGFSPSQFMEISSSGESIVEI